MSENDESIEELLRTSKYEPRLDYLCDDHECCENGSPSVICKYCHNKWPCADYIADRYVDRKRWGDDIDMIEHFSRKRGWEGK